MSFAFAIRSVLGLPNQQIHIAFHIQDHMQFDLCRRFSTLPASAASSTPRSERWIAACSVTSVLWRTSSHGACAVLAAFITATSSLFADHHAKGGAVLRSNICAIKQGSKATVMHVLTKTVRLLSHKCGKFPAFGVAHA
jgi:hypothetical protein